MTATYQQIRNEFLNFFKDKGCIEVKSSSLVPAGDNTLLFTNAGMNQFKDRFAFYDLARKAYAVVSTTEHAYYACIILQKGCL